MNKLKERLFGLIVVIALGVIFIPMLLENTQNPKSNVLQDVPAASLTKNDLNKDQKPEVLAQLKNAPTDKPAVVDETQPIADAKTPGREEDLKVKEKEDTLAQEKAQAEEKAKIEQQQKLEQAKQEQQRKLEQAKLAEQAKIEQEKIKAKAEQDKRRLMEIEQAKLENAKLQQAKLEEEKRQQALQAQEKAKAEKSKTEQLAALEQAKQEAAKREQAKLDQARMEQEKREQAKREQVKREQADFERTRQQQEKHAKPVSPTKHEAVSHNKAHQSGKVKGRISHGFVVQMGSFAEPHNASALLKKLKAAGYPAFTRKAFRQGMQLTIVMVGPYARREDANRLCSTLAMKFQIDGMIVRYEPR
ncbi:MAG: SPOR domain-containing protein [Candidatus Berkiella sp.]